MLAGQHRGTSTQSGNHDAAHEARVFVRSSDSMVSSGGTRSNPPGVCWVSTAVAPWKKGTSSFY